ncbi:hypothetical protein FS749_013033 [Ceratobasidium sp. UAMH 11750]|nr:hypothetical protein FS749_013033 [Ceratobasidium sp. UAMH 11750]
MTRQWAHMVSTFIPPNLPPAPNLSGASSATVATNALDAPTHGPAWHSPSAALLANQGQFVPSQASHISNPNRSQPSSATPDLSSSKSRHWNWGSASTKSAPASTPMSSVNPQLPNAQILARQQPKKLQLAVETSNAVQGASSRADVFAGSEKQPVQGGPAGLPSNPALPSGSQSGSAVARKTFKKNPSHLSHSSVAPEAPGATLPEIPIATNTFVLELAKGSGRLCELELDMRRAMHEQKKRALKSKEEAWKLIQVTAGEIKESVQGSHAEANLDLRAKNWLEWFIDTELKMRRQRFEFVSQTLRDPPSQMANTIAEAHLNEMFSTAAPAMDFHPIVQNLIAMLEKIATITASSSA